MVNARSGGRLDLLFREGNLQIERVSHGFGEVVSLHRHPAVDSAELSIWESGAFWIRRRKFMLGEGFTPWRNTVHLFSRRCCGDHGGAFLSIQRWYAPIKSIKDDWESRGGE